MKKSISKRALSIAMSLLMMIALMPHVPFLGATVHAAVSYSWPTTCHKVSGHWGKESGHYYPYHYGIDIAASGGSSVKAAADGTVYFAKLYHSYGYAVAIKHSDGKVSLYAHMSSNLKVQKGEKVKKGKLVGYVSGTGAGGKLIYSKHLHFGLYKSTSAMNNEDGRAASKISYNPLDYLGKTVSYTIKFASGASSGVTNMPATRTMTSGKTLYFSDLPTPKRSGYTFVGWKNSYDGKVYKNSVIVRGNRTFTAQWQKTNMSFKMLVSVNHDNLDFISTSYVQNNHVYTLPTGAPERPGYTFLGYYAKRSDGKYFRRYVGWVDNSAYCKLYQPGSSMTMDSSWYGNTTPSSFTFYAKWIKNDRSDGSHLLRFSANGGSGTFDSGVAFNGKTQIVIPTGKPTRSGYTFKGWYVKRSDGKYYKTGTGWVTSNASVKIYESGRSYTLDSSWTTGYTKGDYIFYARWTKN